MSKKPLLNQLREKFLRYYEERGHAILPSASLVPENDPTTLFTSSGMQPLVPYLMGEKHPKGVRLSDTQKCFRSNDIEEVGDNRHTTFFEMLGNWSLGDYGKQKQLGWVWELFTKEMGIPPEKLYVTVFAGDAGLGIERDEQAIALWKALYAGQGIRAGVVAGPGGEGDGKLVPPKADEEARIYCYDAKKNWWSRSGEPAVMPEGEIGGPDSEIFYDFGAELGLHEASEWRNEPCHPNCDCGRFIEIGNSVFMEYIKTSGGFSELAQKNVDYGGGLERLVMAAENQSDMFLTSTFTGLIEVIEEVSGKKYLAVDGAEKAAMRVMADHIRAAVMLMADGVVPSNKEQGYVLRRLIRRSIRKGRVLEIAADGYLEKLAEKVIEFYGDYYQEVKERKEAILGELKAEEAKFGKMIEKGLREIEKLTAIDGATAFKLYESFGFPFELTAEIAAERGWQIEEKEFWAAAEAHRTASREGAAGKFAGGLADAGERTVRFHTATHLLHQALRELLGEEVRQMGSNITAERARFDFSFDRALTEEEKKELEEKVNGWIKENYEVNCVKMPKTAAVESGALHFFVEKYPDEVSVYTVGEGEGSAVDAASENWVSREICMGPHVGRTGEIGEIRIVKEKASSKGVRRIYLEFK